MKKLTPKQEKFCQLFVELGNASEAYRRSYNPKTTPNTVHVKACELRKLDHIQKRINEIKQSLSDFNLENNAIKIDIDLYEKIKQHFNSNADAKKWISIQVAQSATKLGIDLSTNRPTLSKTSRYAILHRAGFKCQACGDKPTTKNAVTLHIDHITPYSLGGSNSDNNLQVLCLQCNTSKGNRFSVDHNYG